MQYVVCETRKLLNVFREIKVELEKGAAINLSWEETKETKTLKQLGFIFGIIVKSVRKGIYEQSGLEMTTKQVREMLYQECSQFDHTVYNGNTYTFALRLSEMDKKQTSEFISNVLVWCDENEITLPPEARYLWFNWVCPEVLRETEQLKLPDKSPEYLSHLRRSHCLICGVTPCEAHHVHLSFGLGSTLPDWAAIPLCDECHRNNFGGHITSDQLFLKTKYLPWAKYGAKAVLKAMYEKWREHN